jgi:hypothetical protein
MKTHFRGDEKSNDNCSAFLAFTASDWRQFITKKNRMSVLPLCVVKASVETVHMVRSSSEPVTHIMQKVERIEQNRPTNCCHRERSKLVLCLKGES